MSRIPAVLPTLQFTIATFPVSQCSMLQSAGSEDKTECCQ